MHPAGAYVHMRMCAHVCTLSGTHMCERVHVHVSAPCGCVISFFEAHSPLHSEARETTLRVGSASLPKTHLFVDRFAREQIPHVHTGPEKKIAARGCQSNDGCEV